MKMEGKEKAKITGNFLTQGNLGFPLDCETLDYLQELAVYAEVLGNVAGDKVVVCGCEETKGGSERGEGYVFLKTNRRPEGEVLYWPGGATGTGMHVTEEYIGVSANNVDYSKAYSIRGLEPGYGDEHYDWEDFRDIKTVVELMDENRELRESLARISPPPPGVVEMFAGKEVPENYVLCNGQELEKAEYEALYKALGDEFSTAPDCNGNTYTTREGYFRVPDLRGRFVVGYHDTDVDYQKHGRAGGAKAVALGVKDLPEHSHSVNDYVGLTKDTESQTAGSLRIGDKDYTTGVEAVSGNRRRVQTDANRDGDRIEWVAHETDAAGDGGLHENRPPYYVLSYIIRVR